jgi:hypothetical protein
MKTIKNLMFAAIAGILLSQTSVVRAANEHSDATITWTKHVTAFLPPGGDVFGTIAGVAGEDIGEGTVVGDAFWPIESLPGDKITFEAEYHFTGSKHSLTIRFRTVQSPDNSGVVVGVVTEGWLKGNVVTGTYTARTCDEGVNLTCFDGTFTIKKGTKAQN